MSKDVIIACDFNSKADLMTFLDKFENDGRAFRIEQLHADL